MSNLNDFVIENGVLKEYTGVGGEVIIPDSVTEIGEYAFSSCDGLTNITIPDSVTEISNYAFYNCTRLTSITIPDSVTSIGDGAFYGCTGLKSITIPDSVTEIGYDAFKKCSGLTSIIIPDSVTKINLSAFEGCSGLTNITVDGKNKAYYSEKSCIIERKSKKLILGCKNSIIPDGVTEIECSAFRGCTGLTSVTIPNSVTEIGKNAFEGCAGLTNITIPDSVIEISERAFQDCAVLTSITIPDSVTSIGDEAFEGCKGLTSIIIPDNVTKIGESAFQDCTGLTSIIVPDSVTEIGTGAFVGCDSAIIALRGTVIPNYHWFVSTSYDKPKCRICCPKIHIADLPLQLKFSAAAGFAEKCDDKVEEDIKNEYIDFLKKQRKKYYPLLGDYPLLLRFFTESRLIPVNEASQLIESATDVETKAVLLEYSNSFSEEEKTENRKKQEKQQRDEFEKAVGLKTLTVADYKKMYLIRTNRDKLEIGGYKAMDPVVIIPEYVGKKKVTRIGERAFNGCSGLTSITIPDSVTGIGWAAFCGCAGLTSISIGSAVKEIGGSQFSGCVGLTSITVAGKNKVYYSENNCIIERKSKKLVLGCKNSVIPDSVTEIGYDAFKNCSGLTSIIIPDSVTEIGDYAFYGCTGLTSITIPDSVKEIGGGAFSDCASLREVYYTGTEEQWQNIKIEDWNQRIKKATIHFNSAK